MLSVNLDQESEKYLIDIVSKENTNTEELIKKLLRNYWSQLNQTETVLERLRGIPENLLNDQENLSDRDIRKEIIAEKLKQKNDQRY
jgi:hypothetical protein